MWRGRLRGWCLTKQLVWMTRSFDWNLLKPREKTSATRPSWPRGTRLDICQIIKNQEKFSVLSVPLVTNRHSQWTVKIRQKSKNFRPKSFLLFLKFRAKTINFFFVLQNSQSIPWLNEKIRPNQPQFRCPEEDPIPDVFFSMALIMEKSSVPHRTSNKKKSR